MAIKEWLKLPTADGQFVYLTREVRDDKTYESFVPQLYAELTEAFIEAMNTPWSEAQQQAVARGEGEPPYDEPPYGRGSKV